MSKTVKQVTRRFNRKPTNKRTANVHWDNWNSTCIAFLNIPPICVCIVTHLNIFGNPLRLCSSSWLLLSGLGADVPSTQGQLHGRGLDHSFQRAAVQGLTLSDFDSHWSLSAAFHTSEWLPHMDLAPSMPTAQHCLPHKKHQWAEQLMCTALPREPKSGKKQSDLMSYKRHE